MPARTDLKTILIIGSGPIVIGQACEFDYSGTQAVRALEEEGYRVVLVNPNPATVMTTPGIADSIYVEPLKPEYLEAIIRKEKPEALLSTMGGQTALNCALDLVRKGVLEKYNVEMIAASREAIDMAEDREQFRRAMTDIGLAVKNGINLYTVRGEGRMSCHRALSLMEEGKINGEALITHTFPLEEINEALATFVGRHDDALKVVVHP